MADDVAVERGAVPIDIAFDPECVRTLPRAPRCSISFIARQGVRGTGRRV